MPLYKMKQNVGPHSHRGEWIKPGELVECYEHEIRHALDKFEMVESKDNSTQDQNTTLEPTAEKTTDTESGPETEEMEASPNDDVGLVMQHKGRGRYVVINPATDEKIHEDYLTKKEAESLLRTKAEE